MMTLEERDRLFRDQIAEEVRLRKDAVDSRDRCQEENTRLVGVNRDLEALNKELLDAGEMLWVVLANVDWFARGDEFVRTAERWRDNYFRVADKVANGKCVCKDLRTNGRGQLLHPHSRCPIHTRKVE